MEDQAENQMEKYMGAGVSIKRKMNWELGLQEDYRQLYRVRASIFTNIFLRSFRGTSHQNYVRNLGPERP